MVKYDLSTKQSAALYLLADDTTEYITYGGGANGGKSWLGCFWLLFSALIYPDTRYFIGRNELIRLKKTTYVTFTKLAKRYPETRKFWHYNASDHVIYFANESVIELIDLQYQPRDPLYERYGSSEFTSGWIEEGGEVNFDAYDTLKSRINRWNNDKYNKIGKLFVTCNPKKNWLYDDFYDPWRNGTLPTNMAFIQALVGDNDFREKASIRKLEEIKNKAKRERLLNGNWDYEDEPDQLILYEWVKKCEDSLILEDQIFMGIDVARYGDDLSGIVIMRGNEVIFMKYYDQLNTHELAAEAIRLIIRHNINADNVAVDTDGLGAGVVDALNSKGFYCHEIHSAESPVDILPQVNYEFVNLRSQMWWTLRQCIDPDEIEVEKLSLGLMKTNPAYPRLKEDITSVKYSYESKGKIKIESKDELKKRINRSPDIGDAFVYCNWLRFMRKFSAPAQIRAKKKKKTF